MAKRKIIKIDEAKCNGCGACIPNCPEGALQVIDAKVRLVSDLFCDGLGACIGHCPQGAITIEERQAEPYDEARVMENIVTQGTNVIRAHLTHLKDHGETAYLGQAIDFLKSRGIANPLEETKRASAHGAGAGFSGCPGSRVMEMRRPAETTRSTSGIAPRSQLRQWPIQLMLVPAHAPYLSGADILIAADCVGFAYAGLHEELLKGHVVLVGCPKLDNVQIYGEKLAQILKINNVKSITYAHMEVPCCFGLIGIIESAISASGKKVPFKELTISIQGEKLS